MASNVQRGSSAKGGDVCRAMLLRQGSDVSLTLCVCLLAVAAFCLTGDESVAPLAGALVLSVSAAVFGALLWPVGDNIDRTVAVVSWSMALACAATLAAAVGLA